MTVNLKNNCVDQIIFRVDFSIGALVEMNGKITKMRLGRFLELHDQSGTVQLVAPAEVCFRRQFILPT